ncbi:MAG: M20/M25/M40 family metallo-hydrolase [Planctomycetes bacterium]|nr:M20/M25/M40 family metallo-hydrolase [Planctomycetota bacterium]
MTLHLLLAAILAQSLPREALESIQAKEAFEHVRVLASDEYEGREAGTHGNDEAARYIADRLDRWHLKPAGSDGYLQPFQAGRRTQNVLARLEGADPALNGETVVIGAHFDHIGMAASNVEGDRIYNGADDNASGTAVVLEVAQAFATLKEPPKRSVLFAWWSAEEKGLQGSRHFVRHPTVALKGVVAYLNLDMVGRNDPGAIDIEGTGCSPDLRALFEGVNRSKIFSKIGYETERIKPDTDHYPFYRAGIPAVEFFSGYHDDYHQPGDHVDKVSKEKLERVGRFVALAAWELANAEKRPGFHEDR